MKVYIKYIILLIAVCSCGLSARGEVKARIAALESNSEYMSLLTMHQGIISDEKLLIGDLALYRKLYSEGGDNVAKYRQKVVDVEQSIIDLRVKKSAIESKINVIEQSWIIDNQVNNQHQTLTTDSIPSSPTTENAKRIAESHYAKELLSTMDLKNLVGAELSDKRVATMVGSYISNYNVVASLSVEYDSVSTQQAADSIMLRYNKVDSLNRVVSKNIAREWTRVVDSKNFAYAMLIEKLGDNTIFAKDEKLKYQAARFIDSLSGYSVSDELLSYYATRRSLVELEYVVAKAMQLPRAVDSLRLVRDSLRIVEFNYPPHQITPRLFIDYEPIKFSSKSIYNSNNLIPDGKIYDRGVIYRLLVGSFKTRQAATLFRGAYPIYIFKNDEGLLSYYLGGYESKEEAELARLMLLKKGFKRPEVVEWCDGVAPNHKATNPALNAKYRVEISGLTELSPELRSTIETQGAGRELSKVGASTFVVGVFDELKNAEHLCESLKIINSDITVLVKELK